jgi:prepilin-type processing-associated H-X9-DG protein
MMRRKGIVCPPPVIGFLIPILAILLAILIPAINKTHKIAQRVICSIQMECLGSALMAYIDDHEGKLPPPDKWCDLIVTQGDFVPKGLYCPTSDAVDGESSYAININAAGKNIKKMPPDMVILFETDIGKEEEPRNTPISKRACYSSLKKNGSEWTAQNKNSLVCLNRWNIAGGPEIMSTPHVLNSQPGCNVVYADGHPAFVCGDELKFLRWTAEEKKND